MIWSLLAAHNDDEARIQLREFQLRTFDGDRCPLKLADLELFLGDEDSALAHARAGTVEPDERYWPRGILATTILGALLWTAVRAEAMSHLATSERIDRERLQGGDQSFMPHIDHAAVAAIQGDTRTASASLKAAIVAGWRYPSIARRDPVFRSIRTDSQFVSVLGSAPTAAH